MTLGGGDSLARGAKSAQFSGAGASVDDEVIINPSILAPEEPSLKVVDRRRNYLDSVLPSAEPISAETKEFPDSQFETAVPILDRLLIMRVSVDQNEEILDDGSVRNKLTGLIQTAEYRQHTNSGIVLSAGEFVVMGGNKVAMNTFVSPGDRVFYGDYNSELFPMDKERILALCRPLKVNYEHSENGLRIVRIQDIRLVEKRINNE
jgi:co-chaperonin GroES (HSP10)